MRARIITFSILLVFALLLSACGSKTTPQPIATDAPVVALPTVESPATEAPAAAPTEAPTQAPTLAPTAMVITHVIIPGEPMYKNDQKVTDCNTGERVRLGAATLIGQECDIWDEQKLERPAAAVNGPYAPALDITSAWMGTNQQWLFGKLMLYETDPAKLPADFSAAFEIDIDLDSRGEFLILASGIPSTTWTTDGVQVWQDTDGIVGGGKPHEPDTASGNGYESLLFDAGVAADPDLAWVRLNTSKGLAIEFAFKPSFVPTSQVFAWWGWTSAPALDPAKMEVVDLQQNAATWNLDNTCAWIFNAKPTNLQINICAFAYPTPIPTITPTFETGSRCPAGQVWVEVLQQCRCAPPADFCASEGGLWNYSSCRCEWS